MKKIEQEYQRYLEGLERLKGDVAGEEESLKIVQQFKPKGQAEKEEKIQSRLTDAKAKLKAHQSAIDLLAKDPDKFKADAMLQMADTLLIINEEKLTQMKKQVKNEFENPANKLFDKVNSSSKELNINSSIDDMYELERKINSNIDQLSNEKAKLTSTYAYKFFGVGVKKYYDLMSQEHAQFERKQALTDLIDLHKKTTTIREVTKELNTEHNELVSAKKELTATVAKQDSTKTASLQDTKVPINKELNKYEDNRVATTSALKSSNQTPLNNLDSSENSKTLKN